MYAIGLSRYTADEVLGLHFSRFFTEEDVVQGRPAELLRHAISKGRLEEEGWRAAGARDRARWGHSADPHQCASDRRHESRPYQNGRRKTVPQRSFFTASKSFRFLRCRRPAAPCGASGGEGLSFGSRPSGRFIRVESVDQHADIYSSVSDLVTFRSAHFSLDFGID